MDSSILECSYKLGTFYKKWLPLKENNNNK